MTSNGINSASARTPTGEFSTQWRDPLFDRRWRIVQCKMSTNLAVRPLRFPMQDEHESGKNEVGVARPGASTHVECREPQPRTDPRVSGRKRTDRVCGVWPGRKVRLGGGRAEGPGLWRVGQAGARRRPGVCGESYGNERVSGDAIDPWVSGSRDGAGHALPAASLRAAIHGGRRCIAGGSRSGARAVEWAGHAAHPTARVREVQRRTIRSAGEDQRVASVQPARQRTLPQPGGGVRGDAVSGDRHRRTAPAGPAGPPGIHSRRHSASGRLGRQQGRVSHQCGGRRDAVASGGMCQQDQRSVSAASAADRAAAVSVQGTGISPRQRFRVHQSPGGGDAGEITSGIHQEPCLPQPGQCVGGGQERGGDTQIDGLRLYCMRTRRNHRGILQAAPQPVSELSSALRLRDGESRRAGKTQAPVQARRLPDAVGKAAIAGESRTIPQAWSELASHGAGGAGDERHRVCAPNGRSQGETLADLQNAVSGATAIPLAMATPKARGNAGAVESLENQNQVFHPSHRPLQIPQPQRDLHIPTGSTAAPLSNPKPKKGPRPLRSLVLPLLLQLGTPRADFMLIFQLENAPPHHPSHL